MKIRSLGRVGPAVLALSASTLLYAQSSRSVPTFRSETNYTELPVRVLDADGNFVRGLQQADFDIIEDGKRQMVSVFSVVELPTNARVPSKVVDRPLTLEPAASNEGQHVDGRVYMFVLDDYHIEPRYSANVRRLMLMFVNEHMQANDVGAVAIASGSGTQTFTQDRALLLQAAERFIGDFDPDLTIDMLAFRDHAVLDTIANVSQWMARVRGRRKALVYFSPLGGTSGCALDRGPCGVALRETIRAARRADVSIYAIDPRGLQPLTCSDAEFLGHCTTTSFTRKGEGLNPEPINSNNFEAARMKFAEFRGGNNPLAGIRVLADETGGFAAVDTNNLPAAFTRIVRENTGTTLLAITRTTTGPIAKTGRSQFA